MAGWISGFYPLPIGLSFYFSLTKFDLLQPPRFIGAHNYLDLLHDNVFWQADGQHVLLRSDGASGGAAGLAGTGAAAQCGNPRPAIWRTIIFMPSLVPVVSTAMIWMWLLNRTDGAYQRILELLHVPRSPWLSDPRWAMPALAMMSVWGVGNAVVIYLAGLQDVPQELYEAAELDGASLAGRVWHVTIPLLSPVIFFNLVMAIIGALQVFDIPYIMTAGGPVHTTYFLSMYLYDNAFVYLQMGYAGAMAWIMLLAVLGMTGLAFLFSGRLVHYQGK